MASDVSHLYLPAAAGTRSQTLPNPNMTPKFTTTIEKQELRELPEQIEYKLESTATLPKSNLMFMDMANAPINDYLAPVMQQEPQLPSQDAEELPMPVSYIAPPMQVADMPVNEYLAPQPNMPIVMFGNAMMQQMPAAAPEINYLPVSVQNDMMMIRAMNAEQEQQPNYQQYQQQQQQLMQEQQARMQMLNSMMMQLKMMQQEQQMVQQEQQMMQPEQFQQEQQMMQQQQPQQLQQEQHMMHPAQPQQLQPKIPDIMMMPPKMMEEHEHEAEPAHTLANDGYHYKTNRLRLRH